MIYQCNIGTIFLEVIFPYLEELKLDKSSFVRHARLSAADLIPKLEICAGRVRRVAAPDRRVGPGLAGGQAGGRVSILTWKPAY